MLLAGDKLFLDVFLYLVFHFHAIPLVELPPLKRKRKKKKELKGSFAFFSLFCDGK